MNQQSRTPLLHELYHRYLVDQNSEVFRVGVSQRYTIGTLERLSWAGDRMARRAAVLALGVLADYASNAALGRALQDTDRGVRILADNAIRQLWCRAGTPGQRKSLEAAMEFNGSRCFQEAIDETTPPDRRGAIAGRSLEPTGAGPDSAWAGSPSRFAIACRRLRSTLIISVLPRVWRKVTCKPTTAPKRWNASAAL